MTDASAPPTDRPSPRTAFLLTQLGAHAAGLFAARVAELGLTPRDAGAIRVLGRDPGISQRELAARLGTVPSRLVALVDDLERRGLVARTRSPHDRRNYQLALTADGRELLGRLRGVAEAHQSEVLAVLDADESAALSRLLGKLAGGAGLGADGHPGYRDERDERDERRGRDGRDEQGGAEGVSPAASPSRR